MDDFGYSVIEAPESRPEFTIDLDSDDLPETASLKVIGEIASTFRIDMDFRVNGHPYTVMMIDLIEGGVIVSVERQ